MAKKTIERFVECAIRLYEQELGEVLASARLGLYVRRWLSWAGSGRNYQKSHYHFLLGCQSWPVQINEHANQLYRLIARSSFSFYDRRLKNHGECSESFCTCDVAKSVL